MTNDIYWHCVGVPYIHMQHPLFDCYTCGPNTAKLIRRYSKNPIRATRLDQSFYMNFGFIKSSDKKKEEKIETSRDDFNLYLLIDDDFPNNSGSSLQNLNKPWQKQLICFLSIQTYFY